MDVRDEIRAQLKIIPESVKSGGVMTATLWKQKAERAYKLVTQPRASQVELKTALLELRHFK